MKYKLLIVLSLSTLFTIQTLSLKASTDIHHKSPEIVQATIVAEDLDVQGGSATQGGFFINKSLLMEIMTDEQTMALYNLELCKAAKEGDLAKGARLIKAGAQINNQLGQIIWDSCTEQGCSPLHIAIAYQQNRFIELLLQNPQTIIDTLTQGSGCWSTLALASFTGNIKSAKIFLTRNESLLDNPDNYGRTPLHTAAEEGHESLVVFLLKQGADINALDYYGFSPLMLATIRGNLKIVQILTAQTEIDGNIQSTANLEQFPKGSTALHLACINGYISCAKIMIVKRGTVSKEIKNTNGKKALDYLERAERKILLDSLK